MGPIRLRVVLTILPNRLAEFQEHVDRLVATVREKDRRTLEYDYYLEQHSQVCVVEGSFADSEATLEHTANVVHLLGRLAELCVASPPEVYGDPSIRLLALLAQLKPQIYGSMATLRAHDGMARM